MGNAHVNNAKRKKIELDSLRCMFLGYAENTNGYRVYDLYASKVIVSRSVKLGEREVGEIYESQSPQHHRTVIHATKDADDRVIPTQMDRKPVLDEPMEGS